MPSRVSSLWLATVTRNSQDASRGARSLGTVLRSVGRWFKALLERPWINAAVLVLSGSAIVLGFSIAGTAWSEDSSITDWMQAVATTAAFIAAGIAARYAASILDLEQRRDDDRARTELQHQAERLAAWGLGESGPSGTSGGDQVWKFSVYLRNSSTLPVFDCRMCIRTVMDVFGEVHEKRHADLSVSVMPPGDAPEKVTDVTMNLPPSAWVPDNSTTSDASQLTRRLMIDMTFRDTGSRWWRRDEEGTLTGPFMHRPR